MELTTTQMAGIALGVFARSIPEIGILQKKLGGYNSSPEYEQELAARRFRVRKDLFVSLMDLGGYALSRLEALPEVAQGIALGWSATGAIFDLIHAPNYINYILARRAAKQFTPSTDLSRIKEAAKKRGRTPGVHLDPDGLTLHRQSYDPQGNPVDSPLVPGAQDYWDIMNPQISTPKEDEIDNRGNE